MSSHTTGLNFGGHYGLSAAFKNLSQDDQEDITNSYNTVCSHYGIEATRNNRGVAHENGSIEGAHGHLKRRLEQALLLRGSYNFDSVDEYQNFIDTVVNKHNNRHQPQLCIERLHLRALPSRRTIDFSEATARVTTSSTISVKKVMYSVPSRLIGHQLKIHIYDDKLSCYLGSDHVLDLPRVRISNNDNYGNDKKKKVRCINYRHLINSLVCKPGAFRYSILRDDILPTLTYKKIWKLIDRHCSIRHANKLMVDILKLAADNNCEQKLGEFVLSSLAKGIVPCLGTLQNMYGNKDKDIKLLSPPLQVRQHSLQSYNYLLPSFIVREASHA